MDAVTLFVVAQWRVTADKEYAMTREEQKRSDALYARHLRALEFEGYANRTIDSFSRAASAVGTL
jgi:hypothetical protein